MKRCVGLWVEVEQTNPLSHFGQRGTQVDRRGRFTHATFLVNDRDGPHRHKLLFKTECGRIILSSGDTSLPRIGV